MGVTVRQRSGSWNVFWPLGGGRSMKGRTQSTTWSDEPTARQAAALVRARHQDITDTEVEELILGKVDLPPEETSPCPTLRAWVAQWLASKTGASPGTIGSYEAALNNRILPFRPDGGLPLGDRPMDLITGMDVGKLIHDLRTTPVPKAPTGLRESGVTRYFAVLHAAYEAAIRARRTTHVTRNPCDESDYRRGQRAHDDDGSDDDEPVYLTPDQYRRLRSEFPGHHRPLLDVLAGTGQRWSEATAAAVGAVDLSPRSGAPTVHVRRAWKRGRGGAGRYLGTTKGKRKRSVPIPGWLLPVVKGLVDGRGAAEFLLVMPTGKPYTYRNFLSRVWNPAVARAMCCPRHPPADRAQAVPAGEAERGPLCGDYGGIRVIRGAPAGPCGMKRRPGLTRCHWHRGPEPGAVSTCDCPGRLRERPTPHDLRHSYASWFLDGGGKMRTLQEILGHESVTTTEVYAGLQPGSVDATAAILDAVWTGG